MGGEQELEQVTRRFFEEWSVSFDAMCRAFDAVMAPGCVWEQRPMAVTRSRADAIAFLRRSNRLLGLDTAPVEMLHLAVVGDIVMTERVDHLTRRDGTLIASLPVVGVLEFDGTELVVWREYFDAARLLAQTVRCTVRRRPRPT